LDFSVQVDYVLQRNAFLLVVDQHLWVDIPGRRSEAVQSFALRIERQRKFAWNVLLGGDCLCVQTTKEQSFLQLSLRATRPSSFQGIGADRGVLYSP
jgi:hypothetical protein